LISESKAIISDAGTGKVFCSNATPCACEVAMTAIKQTDLVGGDRDKQWDGKRAD